MRDQGAEAMRDARCAMRRRSSLRAFCATLLLATSLLGCTRLRESFPGQEPEHVWRALVAVAESPDYDHPDPTRRWFVVENDVWLDEAEGRIEIYRRLRRDVHRSGSGPHREDRTWRFRVRLVATDPPEATFVSRDWGVPMQALHEGERYFADVRGLLRRPPDEEATDDDLLDALGLDDSVAPGEPSEAWPDTLEPTTEPDTQPQPATRAADDLEPSEPPPGG